MIPNAGDVSGVCNESNRKSKPDLRICYLSSRWDDLRHGLASGWMGRTSRAIVVSEHHVRGVREKFIP